MSKYVRTTYKGPDRLPGDKAGKSAPVRIYINPNLCGHVESICIECIDQWSGDYHITFNTLGGRAFLERFGSHEAVKKTLDSSPCVERPLECSRGGGFREEIGRQAMDCSTSGKSGFE